MSGKKVRKDLDEHQRYFRSILAADRIMQRNPSRLLYIDISMCRGSSQVKRFVAVLPVSFASRIINSRVVKFPFPQNWAVRTTHRIHRTYCQMQHLFSRSSVHKAVGWCHVSNGPGIPNPSSKSESSAPSVRVLLHLSSGFRDAWCCCCSGCLVLTTCKC